LIAKSDSKLPISSAPQIFAAGGPMDGNRKKKQHIPHGKSILRKWIL
jgi:hypothetical protein